MSKSSRKQRPVLNEAVLRAYLAEKATSSPLPGQITKNAILYGEEQLRKNEGQFVTFNNIPEGFEQFKESLLTMRRRYMIEHFINTREKRIMYKYLDHFGRRLGIDQVSQLLEFEIKQLNIEMLENEECFKNSTTCDNAECKNAIMILQHSHYNSLMHCNEQLDHLKNDYTKYKRMSEYLQLSLKQIADSFTIFEKGHNELVQILCEANIPYDNGLQKHVGNIKKLITDSEKECKSIYNDPFQLDVVEPEDVLNSNIKTPLATEEPSSIDMSTTDVPSDPPVNQMHYDYRSMGPQVIQLPFPMYSPMPYPYYPPGVPMNTVQGGYLIENGNYSPNQPTYITAIPSQQSPIYGNQNGSPSFVGGAPSSIVMGESGIYQMQHSPHQYQQFVAHPYPSQTSPVFLQVSQPASSSGSETASANGESSSPQSVSNKRPHNEPQIVMQRRMGFQPVRPRMPHMQQAPVRKPRQFDVPNRPRSARP